MKKREKFKKWCQHFIQEVRCIMFLQEWFLNIVFFKESACESRPGTAAVAEISIIDDYLKATINIQEEAYLIWKEKKYYVLAQSLVHELAHLLTEPLYLVASESKNTHSRYYIEEIRERQTTRIANIILALLPEELYNGE